MDKLVTIVFDSKLSEGKHQDTCAVPPNELQVPLKYVRLFPIVADMLNDLDMLNAAENEPLCIPNVDKETMEQIILYCEHFFKGDELVGPTPNALDHAICGSPLAAIPTHENLQASFHGLEDPLPFEARNYNFHTHNTF